MPMIAITTSSSTSVNPFRLLTRTRLGVLISRLPVVPFWNSPRLPQALPTLTSPKRDQCHCPENSQQNRSRFGNRTAASQSAAFAGSACSEVRTPSEVLGGTDRAARRIVRQHLIRAEKLTPHRVIGRINPAICVVVAV